MNGGRRRPRRYLFWVSIILFCLIAVLSYLKPREPCQVAFVTSWNAHGVAYWHGQIFVYSAIPYQVAFKRTGLVMGAYDTALDPSSDWSQHWGYALGARDGGHHGVQWKFRGIDLWAVGWLFAAYPLHRGELRLRAWLERGEEVRHQIKERFCRSCGYDLTGNESGICPECGKPITESGDGGQRRRRN